MTDTLIVEGSRAGHKPARKEYRDEQLFARLIGAAVLLAIAVIVLPFVLDGSGSQTEYEYAETMPVEPPRPVIEKSFSSRQKLPPAPAPESFDVRLPETTSLAPLAPAEVTRGDVQTEENVATVVQQTGTKSSQPAMQFETIGNNRSASVNNSTRLESLPLQTGWNIQVASFVRDENAIKLINRLRNQNMAAYANRVEGKSRTMIRVLVGPYGNQIDALALQNRIDRDYRVESIVVRRK